MEIFGRLLGEIKANVAITPDGFHSFDFDWRAEGLVEALLRNWTIATRVMIEHGANMCSRTSRTDEFFPEEYENSTTLQLAVGCNEFSLVRSLLKAATNPIARNNMYNYLNRPGYKGRSTLHYMRGRQHLTQNDDERLCSFYNEGNGLDDSVAQIGEMTRMLLDLGLDMNGQNSEDQTPLSKLMGLSPAPHSSIIAAGVLLARALIPTFLMPLPVRHCTTLSIIGGQKRWRT